MLQRGRSFITCFNVGGCAWASNDPATLLQVPHAACDWCRTISMELFVNVFILSADEHNMCSSFFHARGWRERQAGIRGAAKTCVFIAPDIICTLYRCQVVLWKRVGTSRELSPPSVHAGYTVLNSSCRHPSYWQRVWRMWQCNVDSCQGRACKRISSLHDEWSISDRVMRTNIIGLLYIFVVRFFYI
jgi:hypothetical protein